MPHFLIACTISPADITSSGNAIDMQFGASLNWHFLLILALQCNLIKTVYCSRLGLIVGSELRSEECLGMAHRVRIERES
jgi:hypothetical protein